MKKSLLALCVLFTTWIYAQDPLQSPSTFLGYEIGSQFTRHADVVSYFNHIAENSDLVTYHTYGKTNERRPLTYAIITSPENQKNIENIRLEHLKNTGIVAGDSNPQIAIVWLSYNVHGNEASSTEASMNTLYKLITTKKEWLKNTVVIMDPCANPDGRDRYTNWYNQVKAAPYNIDQSATEHNEPWPGGRPNHYLFDLNRDWAWATQVESYSRLVTYNKWMPHIHVDFHEQGINEPYYFAPAAEPFHEVITPWQKDFQTQIGKNHAKYFDAEGWLFYTKERFDLLYPSYGDTYPTFMGAIGMTYEQAGHGRAGLGIQTDEGYVLTLRDRLLHHTTTGLSTIEISSKNAVQLNSEFKKFFNNNGLKYKSYILQGEADKINALTALLDTHEIQYGYSNTEKISGFDFKKNTSGSMNAKGALVVSTDQPKGKMVKVLFEPDAKLSNPITYDITAWSIPHAYGLDAIAATSLIPSNSNKPATTVIKNEVNPVGAGYITKWNSMDDASFLTDLLTNKIKVRFTEKDFINNDKKFKKGSLIITKSDNQTIKDYDNTVINIANKHQRKLHSTATSFASNGVDFGSPDVKLINRQRIAVLKGTHTSSLSYGEIWHFFEQELHYPIISIDTDYFKSTDLAKYDVLILPNGNYGGYFDKKLLDKLTSWIRKGGKVIAIANAVNSFANKDGFDLKSNTPQKKKDSIGNLIPYNQRERATVKNFITGSIYKTKVDASHPLAFGYEDTYFSLKLGSNSYKFLQNGYNVAYIQEPISVSGFSGENAFKALKNSLVFGETRIGNGSVVYMVDNPLFRAFWENGKLFFVNAIFFTNNNKFRL